MILQGLIPEWLYSNTGLEDSEERSDYLKKIAWKMECLPFFFSESPTRLHNMEA